MAEERELVAGVIQLANLLMKHLAPVFDKSNVTPQQWAVLATIGDEPMNQVEIARRLAVSKQNMTGMMSRLEQLGFIERSGDPDDLRASRAQLTRRGRALIDKHAPAYAEWQKELGHDIAERDLQMMTKLINRLIARLEQRSFR